MSSRGAPGAPILVTEASGVTFGHLRHSLLAARRGVLERPQIVANCQKTPNLTAAARFKTLRGLFANLLSLAGRRAESDESREGVFARMTAIAIEEMEEIQVIGGVYNRSCGLVILSESGEPRDGIRHGRSSTSPQ